MARRLRRSDNSACTSDKRRFITTTADIYHSNKLAVRMGMRSRSFHLLNIVLVDRLHKDRSGYNVRLLQPVVVDGAKLLLRQAVTVVKYSFAYTVLLRESDAWVHAAAID